MTCILAEKSVMVAVTLVERGIIAVLIPGSIVNSKASMEYWQM